MLGQDAWEPYTFFLLDIVSLTSFCPVQRIALGPDLVPYAVVRWPGMQRAAYGLASHLFLTSHTPSAKGETHCYPTVHFTCFYHDACTQI